MRPRTRAAGAVVALLTWLTLLTVVSPAAARVATEPDGVWPLSPRPEVVHGFDPPQERWGSGHRGVDLRGSPGQAVLSAQAGVVLFSGSIAGRGIVVVGHGATRTTYQPVVGAVRVGDRVVAGERIGALATFGSHCWPATCLHWGLIRGEVYLDPLSLVGAGPVRLLPLWGPLPPTAPADPAQRWVPGRTTAAWTGLRSGAPGAESAVLLPVLAPTAVTLTAFATARQALLRLADAPAGRTGVADRW